MTKLLERKDLIKNEKFVNALYNIKLNREGVRSTSPEDLVDDFITDYRGIQANTAKTLLFANYVTGLDEKDPVQKKVKDDLGYAYNVIDKQTESFLDDDSIGFSDKAKALGTYVAYGISDPLNILGFGAGKAVATSVGRPVLNQLIKGALYGAGAEGVAAGTSNLVLQETEKKLGSAVRDKTSLPEVAISAGAGAILGGAFGALGARNVTKNADTIIKESEAAFEALPQGKAAQRQSLKDVIDEVGEESANYLYVAKKDVEGGFNNLDNIGRVEDITEGVATVKYKVKDPETGEPTRKFEKISVDDLQAASSKKSAEYVRAYQADLRASLDKDMVAEGQQVLKNLFPAKDEATEEMLKRGIKEGIIERTSIAIEEIIKEDPNLARVFDPTERISQNFANVVSKLTPEQLTSKLGEEFSRLDLTPSEFANVLIADASLAGKTQNKSSQLKTKFMPDDVDELFKIGERASDKSFKERNKEFLSKIQKERDIDQEFGRFARFVDLWRGSIVSQPATTMRNMIGYISQVPNQTIGEAIDVMLAGVERKALGYSVDTPVSRRRIGDFISNSYNAADSLKLTKYLSKIDKFDSLDTNFFRGFDVFAEDFGVADTPTSKGFSALGKVVDFANVLNRRLDQATKSSAWLSRMNANVVQAKNRGQITDPKVNDFMDVIRQNKFELVDRDMIDDAIEFAYRVNYQQSNVGKEMIGRGVLSEDITGALVGRALNEFENFVQKKLPSAAKFLVPFPRFLVNMQYHLLNRSLLLAPNLLIKLPTKIARLSSGQTESKLIRFQNNKIEKEIDELYKKKSQIGANKDEIQKIIDDKGIIYANNEEKLGLREADFAQVKNTIRETLDATALLGAAHYLRQSFGSDKGWNFLEDKEGNTYDIKSWFPIAQFVWITEYLDRVYEAKIVKGGEPVAASDLLADFKDVMLGANIKSGPINYAIENSKRIFGDAGNDIQAAEKVGDFLGAAVGGIASGFLTPIRVVDDLLVKTGATKALGVGEVVPELAPEDPAAFQERRLQRLDIESLKGTEAGPAIARGFLDSIVREAIKGTPAERFVYEDTPQMGITTGKPRRAGVAPIKQISGLGVSEKTNPVQEAFVQADLNPVETIMSGGYSSIPEYVSEYKKYIGQFIADELNPKVRLPVFIRSSLNDRQDFLLKETKKLRKKAADEIKKRTPLLYTLHTYQKSNLKKRELAARLYERVKGVKPDFTYTGEDNIEQIQMLNDLKILDDTPSALSSN